MTKSEGVVDVLTDFSVGGSYKGVFPTGLISTLQIDDGSFKYGRVTHDDISQPLQIKLNLYSGHESINTNKDPLDSVTMERHFMIPGVKRIPVRSGNVRAVLFLPPGPGPFPAVIDMFGATGVIHENRSALTASRGFASLCLPYFNYEDIPMSKVMKLDLEYFEEATEYLLAAPGVIPDRCGILANCLGGLIGHYMMFYLKKCQALFAINYCFGHLGSFTYKDNIIYKGIKMFDKEPFELLENNVYGPNAEYIHGINEIDKHFPKYLKEISLDGQKHFSYAFGEDDCFEIIKGLAVLKKEIFDDQHHNITIKTYPEAGHICDAPYSKVVCKSLSRIPYYNEPTDSLKLQSVVQTWGGSDQGNVAMQESFWSDALPFFRHHIQEQSPWYQQWLANNISEIKSV